MMSHITRSRAVPVRSRARCECFARGVRALCRYAPGLDASVSRGLESGHERLFAGRSAQLSRYDRTAIAQCRIVVSFVMGS